MTENDISKQIVDTAYRMHTTPGPGLRERVYHTLLAHEMARRDLRATRQQSIPMICDTIRIAGFRAHIIVENKVIADSLESLVITKMLDECCPEGASFSERSLGKSVYYYPSVSSRA